MNPYEGNAGYVDARRGGPYGGWVVTYVAEAQGIEADTKYVVVCETHGTLLDVGAKRKAVYFMNHPEEFCSACRFRQREIDREALAGPVAGLWLNLKTNHEFERFDTFEEAVAALKRCWAESYGAEGHESDIRRYAKYGLVFDWMWFEDSPLLVYWGDEQGHAVRPLSDEELDAFRAALKQPKTEG